tara:strand:+ start:3752 stop:6433 length:2682 start_codon:yes stop_codon:yes gene_type:complete
MKFKPFASFIALYSILNAEIILVPNDYSTIQSGINAASDGDSVLVAPGIYNEGIDFNGKEILVASYFAVDTDSMMIEATIIDAQESGSVVTFDSDENNYSILQGFTLRNGIGNLEDPDNNGTYYTYGGGIYCENSDPIIKDCIIKENVGDEGGGGGAFCYNASPKFYNCVFIENETDDVGGGFYSRSGSSPEFYDCVFTENVADFGAGCYIRDDSPIMVNVSFYENSANNSGGAVVLKDDANLVATNLYIYNNTADGLGGGLYINESSPIIDTLLVAGNSSSSGGGLYIRNPSQTQLSHATIANNSAASYGGGIYMRDEAIVFLNNSIVWGNEETQVYFRSTGADLEISVSYCLFENGEDGIIVNENGEINWEDGNIDGDPYFCNTASGNYYLRENSPCLTSGEDGSLMGCFQSACGPVNLGPVWYVDMNGSDASDGSFETPFATIQHAINVSSDGDTIRLTPNIYYDDIDFDSKAIILESQAFELDNLALVEETTFVPGPLGGSCFVLEGDSNNDAVIRGISFRGGTVPYGGGIVVENCSPTFIGIVVEDNTAEIGGGVFLSGSNAEFIQCTIQNNGSNIGGGIYTTDGNPIFDQMLIRDNIAYWGAGMYSENADPIILNSRLRNNEALIEGGGLYQFGGTGEVKWTSFEQNLGYDFGAGIVAHEAAIELNQTTFEGNISGTGSVMTCHGAAIEIVNSILWDNSGDQFYSSQSSGLTALAISYSDIDGGETALENYENFTLNIGDGIINENPRFCDESVFDYGLDQISVCRTSSDTGGIIGAFTDVCSSSVSIREEITANKFNLIQNFPNPFNPVTTIQFTLGEDGFFSLKIFNLNGQLVNILLEDRGIKGKIYSTVWDGKNSSGEKVTTGMYIYSLETVEGTFSRKMLYLK